MSLISVHVLKCPHIRILDIQSSQPSDQEFLDTNIMQHALDGPISDWLGESYPQVWLKMVKPKLEGVYTCVVTGDILRACNSFNA